MGVAAYFISLLSAGLMKLKVDASVNPVLLEEEDTGLVELPIVAPEDEDKYPFVRPSSAPADVMDRPGRITPDWADMDFNSCVDPEGHGD